MVSNKEVQLDYDYGEEIKPTNAGRGAEHLINTQVGTSSPNFIQRLSFIEAKVKVKKTEI